MWPPAPNYISDINGKRILALKLQLSTYPTIEEQVDNYGKTFYYTTKKNLYKISILCQFFFFNRLRIQYIKPINSTNK